MLKKKEIPARWACALSLAFGLAAVSPVTLPLCSLSAYAGGADVELAVRALAERFGAPLARYAMATDQGKLIQFYLGVPAGDDLSVTLRLLQQPELRPFASQLEGRLAAIQSRFEVLRPGDGQVDEFMRSGRLTPRVARLITEITAQELVLRWGSGGELEFVAPAASAAGTYRAAREAFEAGAAMTREAVLDAARGGLSLEGKNLEGIDLREARMPERTRMSGANLRKSRLDGAVLENVWLAGADFRGADIGDLNISDSHLEKADFRGTDLRRMIFNNGTQFRGALIDSNTQLPFESVREAEQLGFVVR